MLIYAARGTGLLDKFAKKKCEMWVIIVNGFHFPLNGKLKRLHDIAGFGLGRFVIQSNKYLAINVVMKISQIFTWIVFTRLNQCCL